MRNQRKRMWLAAVLAAAVLLAGCFAPVFSGAEGAEPYGDGDGVIPRAQLAGLWVVEEMSSEGETIRPGDYGMEMSMELQGDGRVLVHLGEDGEGAWTLDGDRILITIEGDTAEASVDSGVMILPLGDDVSLKLVKAGGSTPAGETEPAATPEPAAPAQGTVSVPAPAFEAGEEDYVGTWYLVFLGTGGFTGNASEIGLVGETLVMNEDRTGVLSVDPDRRVQQWRMENGIVMMDGQRLILLREDILQVGSELSGYSIFARDPGLVWDGSIPLYDPFAAAEPGPEATEAPAAPVPAAAPEAPGGSGNVRTEVKYTAKSYVAAGYELDAAALGGEYSVVLHDDGTADFTMAGVNVPGLMWKADGDAAVIDYYGSGELRITADGEGIALDLLGSMILKMVP